ncbi:MAG TPA: DUF2062 domain-containing protein [Vicinamibacterales bacterium]
MRERLIELLKSAGPPRRTAAAFALGVFLSFSPFLGLQILLGMGAAITFRLSRAVVFAGLCTNLPWLMLPWYTLSTAAGALVLRAPAATDVSGSLARLFDLPLTGPAFWTQALDIASPFLWSFLVGSTAGALVIGVISYVVTHRYLANVCSAPHKGAPYAPM